MPTSAPRVPFRSLWPWLLIVGGWLLVFGVVERAEAVLGDAVRGLAVFEKNCVACHGSDGKGTGPAAAALPVKPANLTDCRRTAEDDIEMLESIIHHGGPYAGLSSVMPAWDKTLTSVEIADVAAYVKSLCDDPDWVPGELSFPRPLITGKAIPEQEVVLGGQFKRNVRNASPQNEQSMTFSGAVEYRINGLTEVELEMPVSSINLDPGPSTAGLGDVAVAVKRVLFFSVEHLTIVTAALELGLPTGRSSKGLGEGQLVWEPNLRAGWKWRQLVLQGDLRLELPQQTANTESALLYNVALGYELEPDPRLEVVPMVELNTETLLNGANGGRTFSAVLPQLRLKWLAWSTGAGVQVPFTPVKEFDLRVLFDLTYEYSL